MTSVLEPTSHNQQNLEADPKLQEALALKLKGKEHLASTQYKEAVACFNKAIHFNPQDLEAYLKKAIALRHISGKLQASLACFDKVIQSKDPALLAECFEGLVDVGDMIPIDFQPEAVFAFTDRLIQVKPDYIAAYELKIRALAYYERYEESIACFEKMLDVTGVNTPEDRSKAFYDVVINYSENSRHTSPPPFRGKPIRDIDYQAAVLFLERAIQLDPNNQQAYEIKTDSMLILARRLHNFSTLEEMLDFGEKMVNKSAENIYLFEDGILLFCSRVLVYDRFTDVIKQTNKLLLAPGLDLETLTRPDSLYCYKGLALSALGNHQEAIACFDKAIAIEQKFELLPYALGFKAELLVTMGQLEAAIKCIDDLDGNSLYPLQYSRGVVFAAAGRTEEAIECFDEVANKMQYEVYQSHVPTVYLLRKELDILISLGQHEKAAKYSAWTAKELENSEEYDKAFELYDKAIEVYPAGDGFEPKGNLLVKLGRYEAALAEMNKAIQANPENPGYYLLKGKLLHVLGKTEAAIPLFDEAMQRSEEVGTYANEGKILKSNPIS